MASTVFSECSIGGWCQHLTMADGDQPQMTPGAAGDVPDGTLLQSGAVSYKGKEHQLHLMPTGLRLVAPQDQDRAGATTTSECVHLMLFFSSCFACHCLPNL